MIDAPQIETPFAGRLFKVQVLRWRNAQGREVRREVVRHPGAVLIIPVLRPLCSSPNVLAPQSIVMIRNWRIAVNERLWEFPAGKLEPGEAPADAAARELEEETGYRAGSMRILGEFYTSPGFTDELMRVFIAEDLAHVGQRLEPDEDLEVAALELSEVVNMVRRGEIRDGKTIAALWLWRDCASRGQEATS